jgi:hypothetical protein
MTSSQSSFSGRDFPEEVSFSRRAEGERALKNVLHLYVFFFLPKVCKIETFVGMS